MPDSNFNSTSAVPPGQPPDPPQGSICSDLRELRARRRIGGTPSRPPSIISHTFWLDDQPVHLQYGDAYDTLWATIGKLLDQHDIQQQRSLDLLNRLGHQVSALKDECLRHQRQANLDRQQGVWEEN